MEKYVKKICKQLPCRERIITGLYQLIGDSEEPLPNSIYFYGISGTGKTTLINEYFKRSNFNYVYVDCIECYTIKIMLESIINKFYNHQISAENNFSSYARCENLNEFISLMNKLNATESYIICLDNAERLRDMEERILQVFLRLQEYTELNICTILISQIPFEKFYSTSGIPEVIKLNCPQYTKTEILTILLKDFENVKEFVKSKFKQKLKTENTYNNKDDRFKIIENLQIDFYENYLNLFLNVFYSVCRDLPELRMVSRNNFVIYCEPVFNNRIDCNDIAKLWRHISKPLRSALTRIYIRIDESNQNFELEEQFELNQDEKKLAQSLELPYYGKYFLIAAFIASYNDPKEDKRLFVKNHGKQKKRLKTVNANAKLTEDMMISVGPKSFTIDRLLAIFYAILDEKVGLTCNLLSQISSLIHLKLITFVSGESNIMEGTTRLQCTVSLDFILSIGKIIGFNIRQYLCDFK